MLVADQPQHPVAVADLAVGGAPGPTLQRVDHVAALVPGGRIADNDYNLSVSSYVEPEDTREVVDIAALNAEIARIVARQQELRTRIDAIVADLEGGA